jgi:hypothetical protein
LNELASQEGSSSRSKIGTSRNTGIGDLAPQSALSLTRWPAVCYVEPEREEQDG